jgi:hypothetical protein
MRPSRSPADPDRIFLNVALFVGAVAVALPWILTGAVHYYSWVFAITHTVLP